MPATALCLSDHGSRIGGAWRALYICPGGLVRDAQYAAGRVGLIVWLLLVFGGACREAHRSANGQPDLNTSVGPLKNPHNDITLVGEALAKDLAAPAGQSIWPALRVGRRSITSPSPQTSVASARP
jgi:hypothetical protein